MKRGVPGHCMKCGTFRPYLQRDRIVPGYLGGTYAPDNIQWLCANCHEDKSRLECGDASRRKPALSPEAMKLWSLRGRQFTPEHRANIGAARKGKLASDETRARLRAARVGRVISPETRAKFVGRVPSAETRAKISAANKGKQAFLGRTHSQETRAKISAANKGKPKPWLKGKSRPPEVIEKMRQGRAAADAAKKALALAEPIGGIS